MSDSHLIQLLDLVERKHLIDQNNTWSQGSSTYLAEIRKELDEVEEVVGSNKTIQLEEELGDVLWDYLNLVRCLAQEETITLDSVFQRAVGKFDERISGVENGVTWKEIKQLQKQRFEDQK